MNMLIGIAIGMIILLGVVFIIFKVAVQDKSYNIDSVKDIYVGKLENTDSSIQNAMKHLELTHSITQKFVGK